MGIGGLHSLPNPGHGSLVTISDSQEFEENYVNPSQVQS